MAAAQLAGRQRGIVARWQLLAMGWTSAWVSWALRHGHLHRMFTGVYLLGHPVPLPAARELAALLITRGDALSHATAAGWYGWLPGMPDTVELTARRSYAAARPGIALHRTGDLAAHDVRTRDGLPVTSPLRTIFDLAATDQPDLEAAVSAAHAERLISPELLTREIALQPGSTGIERLREIAAIEATGFTRSKAERLLRALCRRAHLPQPVTNRRFGRWELDFLWPEVKLVVEVDGYEFHGRRAQFERDRRKQTALVAAGYVVLRFTWRQLTEEPLAVVAALARVLGHAQ